MKQQKATWNNIVLVSYGLIILIATLAPFRFTFPLVEIGFNFELFKSDSWGDYVRNIILFLPWGFFLGKLLKSQQIKPLVLISLVLWSSLLLSLIVECLQLYLPERTSTVSDILANTFGGLLGGITALFVGTQYLAKRKLSARRSKQTLLPFTFISITLVFICLSTWLQSYSRLNTWQPNYYLTIGNEVNAVRPWSGTIKYLAFSDRNISAKQVEIILAASPTTICQQANSILSNSWIGCYNFVASEDNNPQNKNNLPKLNRQGINNKQISGGQVTADSWLKSDTPSKIINQKISQSSQFTLVTEVATANTQQENAARIISLSASESLRNLTLAQQQNNLVIRLRNSITGNNGSRPQIAIPHVFSDSKFKKIIVTYDGTKLSTYINRSERRFNLQFTAAATVLWQFLYLPYLPTVTSWTIPANSLGLNLGNFIYACLFLVPLTLIYQQIALQKKSQTSKIYFAILLFLPLILALLLSLIVKNRVSFSQLIMNYLIIGFSGLLKQKSKIGS